MADVPFEGATEEEKLEGVGGDIQSGNVIPVDGQPREDLVITAAHFLNNPRVQQSSATHKRGFLEKKGLTPLEIDLAFQRSLSSSSPAIIQSQSTSWMDFFSRATVSVAVIGSACYALIWVYKTYVEPMMPGNKLEESIQKLTEAIHEMNEERRATSERESEQMVKTIATIADLKGEMASIKAMLLSRNQFPAAPKIPSWQQKHIPSTPPSNGINAETQNGETVAPSVDNIDNEHGHLTNGNDAKAKLELGEVEKSNGELIEEVSGKGKKKRAKQTEVKV